MSVKCSITDSVCAKLQQSADKGLAKYGQTLDRTDLSEIEWLEHHQAELLDAAKYVEKLIQIKKGKV